VDEEDSAELRSSSGGLSAAMGGGATATLVSLKHRGVRTRSSLFPGLPGRCHGLCVYVRRFGARDVLLCAATSVLASMPLMAKLQVYRDGGTTSEAGLDISIPTGWAGHRTGLRR
jgi:hypothetical protein